jgi:protein tyrosine phosphatase
LTWPDFGAPEEQDYKIIKTIIEHLRAHHWGKRGKESMLDAEQLANIPPDNKIVLHCSAGIGRTGTLTAIYNLQQTVLTVHDYILRSKFNICDFNQNTFHR